MASKETLTESPVYCLGYEAGYALALNASTQALPPLETTGLGVQTAVITFPATFNQRWAHEYQAGHSVGQFDGYRQGREAVPAPTAAPQQPWAAPAPSVPPAQSSPAPFVAPVASPAPYVAPVASPAPYATPAPSLPQSSRTAPPSPPVDSRPGADKPRGNLGLNLLLFVGAGLVIAAAAVMIAVMGSDVSKFIGILALAGGTYALGLALYNRVRTLRPAAVAFLGIGLASIPLAGVAFTYYLDVPATTSWLVASLVGVVAFAVATLITRSEFVAYFAILSLASAITSPAAGFATHLVWQIAALIVLSTGLTVLNATLGTTLPPYLRRPARISGAALGWLMLGVMLFVQPQITTAQMCTLLLVSALNFAVTARIAGAPLTVVRSGYGASSRILAALAVLFLAEDAGASSVVLIALAAALCAANLVASVEVLRRGKARVGGLRTIFDTLHDDTPLPEIGQPAPIMLEKRSPAATARLQVQGALVLEFCMLLAGLCGLVGVYILASISALGQAGGAFTLEAAMPYLPVACLLAASYYLVVRLSAPGWMIVGAAACIALGDAVNHSVGAAQYGGLLVCTLAVLGALASVAVMERLADSSAIRVSAAVALGLLAVAAPVLGLDADRLAVCVMLVLLAGSLAIAQYSLRVWWGLIPAVLLLTLAVYQAFALRFDEGYAQYLSTAVTGAAVVVTQQLVCLRPANGAPSASSNRLRVTTLLVSGVVLGMMSVAFVPSLVLLNSDWAVTPGVLVLTLLPLAAPTLGLAAQSLRPRLVPTLGLTRRGMWLGATILPAAGVLWAAILETGATEVLAGVSALALAAGLHALSTSRLGSYWQRLDASVGITSEPDSGSLPSERPLWPVTIALVMLLCVGGGAATVLGNGGMSVFLAEMLVVLLASVSWRYPAGRVIAVVGIVGAIIYLSRSSAWAMMMIAGFAIIAVVILLLLRAGRASRVAPEPVSPHDLGAAGTRL